MSDNQLIYKIAISQIPGVGAITAKKLIAYCGSVEGVFKEKKNALLKIPGVGSFLANNISKQNVLPRAETELNFIEKYQINTHFYLDKNYPHRLKECEDAPILFFTKGNIDFNNNKIISIVGTRNITSEGKENCQQLIRGLAPHNPVIVSGLAYGVDVCAHKEALKNKLPNIAVLAHGLDTIYPSTHKDIAKNILQNGSLVSEYLSQTKMDRNYFLQRNRIVAGLSDATIVIESAKKGGALTTADMANSYNREVFAFPGRTTDRYSTGCNNLIKTNAAHLVENAADVEFHLGWNDKSKSVKPPVLFFEPTEEQKPIIELLKSEKDIFIDELSFRINLPMNQLSVLLLDLEFAGVVKSLPGKRYALVS